MLPGYSSVISAAVIGGDLIIGLSDGSQINCGRVQGPQGLTGDSGPIGAPGTAGVPGNTILTVRGAPEGWLGRDGDFAINTALWEIYGPRAGGVWGSPTPLRGNRRNGAPDGVELFGSNPQGSSSGGGIKQIDGGGVITTTKVNDSVYTVETDINTDKGLEFADGKIAIHVGDGLEFDAATGAIKSEVNEADYAKITYVDAQDEALSVRIESNDELIALNAAAITANTVEINALNTDVDELQIKVETLEGASMSGVWALLLTGSSRPGKVLLYKEGFQTGVVTWDDVKYLGFSPEDAGGVTHDFSEVVLGEYIRFTPANTGGENNKVTFKTIDVGAASSGIFGVEVSIEKGEPINEESFGVEFLPPFDPSQYATVDYVDEQDKLKANKTGATLTGTYSFKVGGEARTAIIIEDISTVKQSLNLWCPGGSGTQIKYVGRHGSEHWLQNYNDDDDAVLTTAKFAYRSYSFLAQPNITYEASNQHFFKGQVNIDGATALRGGFSVKTTGSTVSTILQVLAFSTPGASKAEYYGKIDTSSCIATKKYVDDNAGGVTVLSGTPSGITIGSMWYDTSTASLYIKVS